MTPSASAFMFSAATDRPGGSGAVTETARVVRSDRGLRVNGYLLGSGDDEFGASYSLLCDPAGNLRRLTVRADSGAGERSLTLTRVPAGPWVLDRADGPQTDPALAGIDDVLLSGSLLSRTLPIARTGLLQSERAATEPVTVTVAVLDVPGLGLSTESVRYRVRATDPDGVADVTVRAGGADVPVLIGPDGFVAAAPVALAR